MFHKSDLESPTATDDGHKTLVKGYERHVLLHIKRKAKLSWLSLRYLRHRHHRLERHPNHSTAESLGILGKT